MKYAIVFTTAAICFMYSPLQAQDNGNNVVVVSYFKCNSSDLGKVNQMTKNQSAPILNKLVEEQKLLDWGTMSHYWGDEWNYILYYVAKDLGTFEKAFDELVTQTIENHPKFLEELDAMCPEHKDNIYHQLMGYQEGKENMD